ncbi:hypothetical protein IW492_02550 [Enterococcus sp. BWB1-3]|uniref:hypothetical protein n=1 Tax=Enterococcus sp. BWB1-3 TaxID=2787713 RepID=UPI0019208F73|nr:hypothetical protein [Enterococcus sp. BWB1-3]MBL1228111.1 hypothetical protein [Enterococcus sp. BWB1-3]
MEILLIVIASIVSYLVVLSRKTVLTFKKEGLSISYFTSFVMLMFIFKVHLRIIWERKVDFKFVVFVLKQFILRYDIPLILLIEVAKDGIATKENKREYENKESLVSRLFKSRTVRQEYADILEDQCIA